MNYVVFDDAYKWQITYCNKQESEKSEDIIKSTMFFYRGKFKADDHVCINGPKIKNDENLFILNESGNDYIWQVGSKVTDMSGFIIPHAYYVRKIGILI